MVVTLAELQFRKLYQDQITLSKNFQRKAIVLKYTMTVQTKVSAQTKQNLNETAHCLPGCCERQPET